MFWFPISIISYFLNSVALLMDKFLLEKKIPNPAIYTLAICLLGVISLALLPFGWQQPGAGELFWALAAGMVFTPALYFMFLALKNGESSRVVPFLGGLQPIIILPLAWYFLGEVFSPAFYVALFLFCAGTILISYEQGQAKKIAYAYGIIAAVLFAASLVMSKWVYYQMDTFITPFVLTRLGSALAALPLIFLPGVIWLKTKKNPPAGRKKSKQPWLLLIIGQSCGALASVGVNWAIAISHNATTIINAMQGLQYVFLFVAVLILTKFFPKILKENMRPAVLVQKALATGLIILGLVLVAF
ncbi:MAG: EamA family transporter [Candidatus Buchananbacteria bacterium]